MRKIVVLALGIILASSILPLVTREQWVKLLYICALSEK
jgi:uncharacterized membrane protein